jgi:hypothetical protein
MRCTYCLVSQYIYTLIPSLQIQFQHPVFGITLHSSQIRISFICPKLQFSSWVGFKSANERVVLKASLQTASYQILRITTDLIRRREPERSRETRRSVGCRRSGAAPCSAVVINLRVPKL